MATFFLWGGNLARINIEESLFKDSRWMKLLIITKCEYKALGLLTAAWRLAQKHWLKSKMIPKKAWLKDLEVLVEVEFASRDESGNVYVKGSKKAFAWLDRNSKGGKAKAAKLSAVKIVPLKAKKNASTVTPQQTAREKTSQHKLIEIWNEHCAELPKVKRSNASRDRKIISIWKDQTPDEWVETVKKITQSKFCTGKNKNGWRATFDWLLQPDTWLKVNEGKYENNKGFLTNNHTLKYDKLDELEALWEAKGDQ